ncbi:MAG: FIST C-terminal domain-containing protein [Mycobacteriales bacterium]
MVGALISSDAPFCIGTRHGWQPVGEPMTITKSVDGRVFSLDGRPALDAYLDRLVAPAEAYTDLAAFRAFAATRPLSIKRRTGGEVRGVDAQPDFANRSLSCSGELPQGGQAWAMRGDTSSVIAATREACDEAMGVLGDRRPIAVMAFDCLGRYLALGDAGIKEELSIIAESAGGAALSGLYTYGEIARTRGMHGYHHMTLVVLAIA